MSQSLELPADAPPEVVTLGTPEQIHPSNPTLLWMLGIVGLMCLGPAGMCFWFLVAPFGKNPPPPELAMGGGCVFAVLGLTSLVSAILIRLPTWIVFRDALVELKGSKAQVFAWEDITELRQETAQNTNIPGMMPMRYTVVARDGRERPIESIVRNRQELTASIAQRMRDRAARPSRGQAERRPEPARKPGEPISRHEVTLGGLLRRYSSVLLLGVLFLLLGVGFLVMSVFRPDAGALAPGIVITLGSLPCFLPLLLWGFGGPSEAVVMESGVLWSDDKGGHKATWAEIRDVLRKEVIVNQTFRQTLLKLVLADGTSVAFDHRFSDYDRLAEEVQRRHAQSCYEAKRQEFSQGEARFGPIQIRPGSITVQGETIAWQDLRKYAVVNGHLMFATPAKSGFSAHQIAMYEVPNYPVLLILLEEMGYVPESGATFFQDR
jgi:hypothetical protein